MRIELLQPADGSSTEPLQRHPWLHQPAEMLDEDGQDRSCPRPVRLAWRVAQGPLAAALTFDVRVEPASQPAQARVLRGLREPAAELTNLLIGTPYRWQVSAFADGRPAGQSPQWHFKTHPAPPRWIEVPGVTNVRDIGGWPLGQGRQIRQGMVYRSSEMDSHHQITPAGRRVFQDELGIRTDLDLRGLTEPAAPVLDPQRVQWVNVPVLPYEFIRQPIVTDAYRRLFQVFAEPARYPILVHCWGGADRTGTVALLLGALLGQPEALLAMDYELTSLSIWGIRSRHSAEFCGLLEALSAGGGDEREPLADQVQRYLLEIGVTDRQIAAIRELLIVP